MDLILDELEGVLATPDWQNELDEGNIISCINEFLAGLKEKDRVIFVRRYYYSDSISDLANSMGDTVGAVAMRLKRLRAKLKINLEKEGISI